MIAGSLEWEEYKAILVGQMSLWFDEEEGRDVPVELEAQMQAVTK